jgi:hypothetical protein
MEAVLSSEMLVLTYKTVSVTTQNSTDSISAALKMSKFEYVCVLNLTFYYEDAWVNGEVYFDAIILTASAV